MKRNSKIKLMPILGNFVGSLLDGDNIGEAFTSGWRSMKRDGMLWGGLFASRKQGFFDVSWDLLKRFTWELPQTITGFMIAQGDNDIHQVNWVKYKYGATVLNAKGEFGGFTVGNYIIGDKNIKADVNNYLFQHEFGHVLQSEATGWGYLPGYALPSLQNAKHNSAREHDYFSVEQDANRRAFLFFNKHSKGFYTSGLDEGHGWHYEANPLDIYGDGGAHVVDYHDKSQIRLLNNLKITPSFGDYVSWLAFPPIGPLIQGLYFNPH